MAALLRRENLVHALAHPLFAVNDRLRVEHFEKCLLLFDLFEVNGCRDALQNKGVEDILGGLDATVMAWPVGTIWSLWEPSRGRRA